MSYHDDVYHVTPFKTYITIFGILVVLTFITVWASRIDFGALGAIIAFGIATAKALLVMAYFMHLKSDSLINRFTIGTSFFFLFLLYLLIAIDIYTRINQESTL